MCADFVNLTPENLAHEHLCCIIRSRKPHPGVEAKRQWLSDRLPEGHVFRKRNAKATVFIEYAPLETAWVPIVGDNYYYLYCLWVSGDSRGHGYGRSLMEYCLADAREKGRSGVCMLGAQKQKAWLADQSFARKFGFEVVDTTANGYALLALSFDGTTPRFAPMRKSRKSSARSSPFTMICNAPMSIKPLKRSDSIASRTASPFSFFWWTRCKRQRSCPVCSTTGPYFTTEGLKP